MTKPKRRRSVLSWAALLFALVALSFGANQALFHPDTPLPAAWNPTEPFDIGQRLTPLTEWKMRGVIAQPGGCQAALEGYAQADSLEPLIASDTCGIAQRVSIGSVGSARTRPFETTCEIALRMAMWERHGLQPAARELLGSSISEILHFSSYNCRRIRTSSGESDRWSTHARARAVDVSGFVLEDGELIDLREHWAEDSARGRFLAKAQETACEHFGLVLGPEYNALHADHFHIQLDWQGCR